MKICLDAGHSYGLNGQGQDPGACNERLDLKESVIAMEIVSILGKMLTNIGHEVVYTRTDGMNNMTLGYRTKYASSQNADIFISIHLNSSDNTKANGIETLRYPTKNPKTISLAENVQRELIAATHATDRGVKLRSDLYVLKHTSMPAILVETGFISNDKEALKLKDYHYQTSLCQAIVDGIQNVG